MNPASIQRLRDLQAHNQHTAEQVAANRQRFAALAGRHQAGTAPVAVTGFNLFQTPEPIAQRMAAIAWDHLAAVDSPLILEPSAGLGRITKAIRDRITTARIHAIEIEAELVAALRKSARDGDRIQDADFLELDPSQTPQFDAVVMNPPFKNGLDITHITHARKFLKPGGILVSLCYDGSRQNAKLRPLCTTWEQLPAGSFRSEGTGASVVLITIK